MAAKSGGDFWVVGRGGTSGGGNSAAAKRASSQPSGSGQPIWATAARFKYSCTVLTESEQLRAICRCSSFSSFLSRRTSLILRVDFLLAGKRFSLQGQGLVPGVDVHRLYLWKTFRGQAEQRSGVGQKVFGFRQEWCSASPRNGVRNHPGMLFGFSPECCSGSARNRVRVAPEYAVRDKRLIVMVPQMPESMKEEVLRHPSNLRPERTVAGFVTKGSFAICEQMS